MVKGEGMTPDEIADGIRKEKGEKNVPIKEDIPPADAERGVVYSSKTPEPKKGKSTNKFEAPIKAVVEDIDIPAEAAKGKEKPKDAEGAVLDEGAEDLKPIDVKNSEEESPVSKDMEAIFIDAADLLQAGDLEGVQRMMDSYENDDGFKLELTKEMQRRLDAVKKAEAEDVSTKNVDKSEDKPKTKRDPAGGIAPGAMPDLTRKLKEAAETMDAMKRNSEGAGEVEAHDEVAPETSPEAEQKDEEQAETKSETEVFESTSEDTSASGEGVTLESSPEQNVRRDAVKKELDEDAKKAGGEAENARLDDDGGTPRGVEVPAESKEEDGETPPEPKDKVKWEDWRNDVSGRVKDVIESFSEDEKIAAESLLAYAYGGELTDHAKEHIDLLRNLEGFEDLLELMREASENGDNQEFQDELEEYLSELNIEADFERLVREYLESERDGDTDRMQEIKDELNELLDKHPDKEDLFLGVSERVEGEMGADLENEATEGGGFRSIAREMLQPRLAAKYLSEAGDEIGRALLGMGLGLHEMARKSGTYAAAGRGLGILAFLAGGLAWLTYKGAKMALFAAYKRASKHTPPALKGVFDKMIMPAQSSKSGGKGTGKK